MPKYTLIELNSLGEINIRRSVVSRELFTSCIHKGIQNHQPFWFCYIPDNAPKEVQVKKIKQVLFDALNFVHKEVQYHQRLWLTLYNTKNWYEGENEAKNRHPESCENNTELQNTGSTRCM